MAFGIKLSYHKRLFLLLLSFSWSIMLCFLLFQYTRERDYKSDFVNAQLQQYNAHLLYAIDGGLPYEEYVASLVRPFDELRLSVISLTGVVVYDNMVSLDSLGSHLDRPEVAMALKWGEGYHISRTSESDGRRYFYSATKGERCIVRSAVPYSLSLQEMLRPNWNFLWVMFLVCLLMSLLAYFATHAMGRSIERLNIFAEKVQAGEPFEDLSSFPNDELGAISKNIVRLYSYWQQTIADRDRAHDAMMREMHEKNKIKRELTNNINHELKTPVASMQVCLETLLSGIKLTDEKRTELIERCYANNNRLCRLLNDVSLITRMEDGGQIIARGPVNINEIVKEMADELNIMPEEERMTLHVCFGEEACIWGNLSLVSSIFRNLTENAVAYSGGRNIYVSLVENNDDECRIRFEDDGCGVADDQLERLFERFYRVDKGRSRRLGGTGLGLAIVKHAVQFHGGIISVSNRPEGGLRFDFSLRK